VKLYEFGELLTLRRLVEADSAVFLRASPTTANAQEASIWRLEGVGLTEFAADGQVTRTRLSSLELPLYLSPARLGALMVKPEQMSARELFLYVDYLQAGKQASGRYEIAFWKKMIYPVAVWVMLVLALPAAYIQARGGALGLKVFLAIVAGIGFHLANSLFSHLGLLNDWPAAIVAAIPSLLALAAGLFMLWQLQRRAF
jgi:lipopolysaccharide export system permease protein